MLKSFKKLLNGVSSALLLDLDNPHETSSRYPCKNFLLPRTFIPLFDLDPGKFRFLLCARDLQDSRNSVNDSQICVYILGSIESDTM